MKDLNFHIERIPLGTQNNEQKKENPLPKVDFQKCQSPRNKGIPKILERRKISLQSKDQESRELRPSQYQHWKLETKRQYCNVFPFQEKITFNLEILIQTNDESRECKDKQTELSQWGLCGQRLMDECHKKMFNVKYHSCIQGLKNISLPFIRK